MSSAMREPDPAASAPPPPGRPPRTFGQRFLGIFKRSNRHLLTEMIRYGFVSVLAFAVDYGVLIGLTELAHLDYLWSATISFILGLATNWICSHLWVFGGTSHSRRRELAMFALIGVVGLGLNNLLMWTFTEHVGLHYAVSKLISTGIVFFWNFLARRFLIYTGKPKESR
ncbi:GtrA family protein [Granulicoccus phenolivorans]|uniref:GtrA family protein n=1 Tax=Granulicoccus phenolivorans TaxID=266854 RepID=UPI0009DBD9F0|nr:GtrA family protein [Granulicoccus phenolivorans]